MFQIPLSTLLATSPPPFCSLTNINIKWTNGKSSEVFQSRINKHIIAISGTKNKHGRNTKGQNKENIILWFYYNAMFVWKLCWSFLSGPVAPLPQTTGWRRPLRGWAINNKKWCPHNVGPFSPLSASTFVQPFFPHPPFCQAPRRPPGEAKIQHWRARLFIFLQESLSGVVVVGRGS